MKTKLLMPWNVKVGQRLVYTDLDMRKRSPAIISIDRRIGRHTGKLSWYFTTEDGLGHMAHAKLNALPATKIEVRID